jgi:hypothetical protein
MTSNQDQRRVLRPNMARKREIVLAIAWRGLLYTLGLLVVGFGIVFIFVRGAPNFFLNPNLELSSDQVAILYIGASLTATILGWLLALNHALHIRYSHFRIVLLAEPRKVSWLRQLINGTDKVRKRRR